MKTKSLLLSAAMIASSAAAFAQTNITPERFDFSKQPEGQFKINYYNSGANPSNAFQPAFDGSDAGYLLVAGAPAKFGNSGETPETGFTKWFEKATQIVDLGGEVGKVLMIKGPNSTYEKGPAAESVDFGWFNYNFYTPQSTTPVSSTKGEHPIRMRLVFQIVGDDLMDEPSVDQVFKVSAQTWANNPTAGGEKFTAGDYYNMDMEEFTYKMDYTKWQIFEFDTEVGSKEGNPTRMKVEFDAAPWSKTAVLLKEISFIADPTGEPIQREFVTYKPGDSSSIKDLMKEAAYTVSGRQVTFATAAVVYGLNGAVVATAEAGETLSLTPGFYVVKANNEGSKLMIK